jgi:hypothetical protein
MSDAGIERKQIELDRDEAQMLRLGMVEPGIERIRRARELNEILVTVEGEYSSAEIPEDLEAVARFVAQLVIKSELRHMTNLLEAERYKDLDSRVFSDFGLFAKVVRLRQVLGTEDSDLQTT